MYIYNLTKVTFSDGTEIVPAQLTVLIGPNNAGKSRALRDRCANDTKPDPRNKDRKQRGMVPA